MIYIGQILVITALCFVVWGALKNKQHFWKIFFASSLVFFAGIILIFQERLEEITVNKIGSLKMVVERANQDANEVFQLRTQIEEQTHKIDDLVKEAAASLKKIQDVQETINSMKKYGKLAEISFNGKISFGGGISGNSAFTNWGKEYVKVDISCKNGNCTMEGDLKCSAEAFDQYRAVIEEYPYWPFAHYTLAVCFKKQGNESWKEQANKALAILEKTTAVPNHHPDHDMIKMKVEELLK